MRSPALPFVVALALIAGGCDRRRPDDVPVVVSAIGGPAELRDPARGELDFPQRVLLGATAQGLVRFDANGGIEPGIAERWIVTDEGRSYIFRLRQAQWPDGSDVTADDVIASLRAAIAPRARSALAPFVAVIDEVVEMTPQVVEVRLKYPRPDLLKLFAQPEFAILRRPKLAGSGPFRVIGDGGSTPLLRPALDPNRIIEEPEEADPADDVRLRGERAALALARFARRESDLVLGGTFHDWPLLDHAGIAPANLRLDPAAGLFGLAIVSREGFTEASENRAAMAMAIDRAALTGLFRQGWSPVETLLPAQLDSSTAPAAPDWVAQPLEGRRIIARNRVAAWHANNPDAPLTIRVAMPRSPGTVLVWSRIARDLMDIGLEPIWVEERAAADLRLIDAVAPYDSARWFMVTACRGCPNDLTELLETARDAQTLGERAQALADADLAFASANLYIPIAQPLRWSVAAMRLRAWQGNARAWHPLTHLRDR